VGGTWVRRLRLGSR